jgi:hypothetical protein
MRTSERKQKKKCSDNTGYHKKKWNETTCSGSVAMACPIDTRHRTNYIEL